jgi:hypothetical protein
MIDFIKIAKEVDSFYLSSLDTGSIIVNIGHPINDAVRFVIIRKLTYQETLNQILGKITLYFSTLRQIKHVTNGVTKTYYANSIKTRKHIIEHIYELEHVKNSHGSGNLGRREFID